MNNYIPIRPSYADTPHIRNDFKPISVNNACVDKDSAANLLLQKAAFGILSY